MSELIKILVSQPEPVEEKTPYHNLRNCASVSLDFKPLIHIEGVGTNEFRKYSINFMNFNAVIFTSKIAIDNFFRTCKENRIEMPEDTRYFCVTEAVAFYLQKYIVYRKRKVAIGDKTIEDLANYFEKYKACKFLLPISEGLGDNLIAYITKLKVSFKEVVLYRTVCSKLENVNVTDYNIVATFTPKEIQSLLENFPNFNTTNVKLACFGQKTQKAAQDANLKIDIVSPIPESPSMAMALENYIKLAKL